MSDTYVSRGSTRERIDPATEDLQRDILNKLTEIESKVEGNSPDLLDGPTYVTVNTTSKTLEELGVALHNDLKQITLVPDSAGIYWADGAADANSAPLPANGVEIDCRKTSIYMHEFYAASAIKMQIVQEG